jgi:phytoene synthase
MADPLSPLGALVRRHDPDRFLTALFAPAGRRETLFLLYAFNHELARAREVASEPTLALIRLQWWREVVEGARRRHEVAGPLGAALDAGTVEAADLLVMIAGREAEAEPTIPTLADFRAYARATAGELAAAAGRVLGADGPARERLRALGAAYATAGVLRSLPVLAAQGRCLLPEDLLAAHGLHVHAAMHAALARPDAPALAPVRAALAGEARRWIEAAGRLPRAAVPAGLVGTLARRDLRRGAAGPGPRGFGDRLAVVAAAARGRP